MGVFEQFPYTNYHGQNLDWLLRKIRAIDAVDAHQAQQIKALEDWIDGANIEQLVDDKLHEMLDNGDFNDIVAQALGIVVTPQLMGYPDTKSADEAFDALAQYTTSPIIIPEGTYNISQVYELKNVVLDMGEYSNFVPMYKRKNNVNLQSFGAGKTVTLPSKTSYMEAVCYLNGYYYGCAFDYGSGTESYVVKYNTSWTQTAITYISASISPNAPANIYTDGESIYVDMVGKTIKYDEMLNIVAVISAAGIQSTAYFNGSFWGVNINTGSVVSVYKLDASFNIIESHAFYFDIPAQDQQSMTIHNGLMYITTADGYFAVIDMFDWSYELIYYRSQLEIEKIMFVGDAAWYIGHDYGVDGKFYAGQFNGGQTVPYFGIYDVDGNTNNMNLASSNKFGMYRFTNYPIGNFGSSGTLFVAGNIAFAKIGHYFFTRNPDNSVWYLCGADGNIELAVLDTNLTLVCRPWGAIQVVARNYTQNTYQKTISRDNSDIFRLAGVSTYQDRTITLFGRDDNNGSAGASMAAMRVVITSTAIYLRPTVIAGSATLFQYNDCGTFCS